jgi:hypothetical protein
VVEEHQPCSGLSFLSNSNSLSLSSCPYLSLMFSFLLITAYPENSSGRSYRENDSNKRCTIGCQFSNHTYTPTPIEDYGAIEMEHQYSLVRSFPSYSVADLRCTSWSVSSTWIIAFILHFLTPQTIRKNCGALGPDCYALVHYISISSSM